MTKPYAAKRLLEHGRLSFHSFWRITGWTKDEAKQTLDGLVQTREVERLVINNSEVFYGLTEVAP